MKIHNITIEDTTNGSQLEYTIRYTEDPSTWKRWLGIPPRTRTFIGDIYGEWREQLFDGRLVFVEERIESWLSDQWFRWSTEPANRHHRKYQLAKIDELPAAVRPHTEHRNA